MNNRIREVEDDRTPLDRAGRPRNDLKFLMDCLVAASGSGTQSEKRKKGSSPCAELIAGESCTLSQLYDYGGIGRLRSKLCE